jgi:hypothetical protein
MKLEIFESCLNIKFYQNPSNCSMRTGGHNGMIDMTTLVVAFHNFVNAPNKTDTKERVRNAAPCL